MKISKKLVIPYKETDEDVKDMIERILISELKDAPSEWGIMISDKLKSLEINEFIDLHNTN